MNYEQQAKIYKALSDPKRIVILELLHDGEKCACKLQDVLGVSQSGLSYHMKILSEVGIIQSRQEGKWIHYCLDESQCSQMVQDLTNILNQ